MAKKNKHPRYLIDGQLISSLSSWAKPHHTASYLVKQYGTNWCKWPKKTKAKTKLKIESDFALFKLNIVHTPKPCYNNWLDHTDRNDNSLSYQATGLIKTVYQLTLKSVC